MSRSETTGYLLHMQDISSLFLQDPLARPGLLPVDELYMTLRDTFDVPLESFALRSSYGDYLASLYGNYIRS